MTTKDPQQFKFPELLQNEMFIRWRFFRDAESEAFWSNMISKNPDIEREVILADEYLKDHFFKKQTFNPIDKQKILDKIKRDLKEKDRKHKRFTMWMKYAAVAVVIFAIGIVSLIIHQNRFQPNDIISGSILSSQDIQLIVNNRTTIFSENITIKVKSSGIAEVKQEGNMKKSVDINIKNRENTINKLIVPYGKRSKVVLADGTKVWLNAGSTFEFPSIFAANKREVNLSGEMYIEVARDEKKPFFVHTNDFNVRVLGTKFNVSAYKDFTHSVALLEGRIALKSDSEKLLYVSPNEQATLTQSGEFIKETVANVDDAKTWVEGYLVFRKTPMTEVLKQIERYYNLSFNYDESVNLHKRTCTGKIYLSQHLDDVMETVALLSSTIYKKIDTKIYIITKSSKNE